MNVPKFRLDNVEGEGTAKVFASVSLNKEEKLTEDRTFRSLFCNSDCSCDSERTCTCNVECRCEEHESCNHCRCDDYGCRCLGDCGCDNYKCRCDEHCGSDCGCQSFCRNQGS